MEEKTVEQLAKEKNVIEVLEKIRPYIQRDGGDLEFVALDQTGRVIIRMLGACTHCAMIDTTVYDGIESILLDEVPGITSVQVIE